MVIGSTPLQQWTGQSKAAGTTLAMAVPTNNHGLFNSIFVGFVMDNAAGTVSATDNQGNTWVVDRDLTNASGVRGVLLRASNVKGGVKSTVTITHPSVTARAATAMELSGVARPIAVDQTNSGSGTGTTNVSSGSITPSRDGQAVVGYVMAEGPNGDGAPTQPAWVTTVLTKIGTTGGVAATNQWISGGMEVQTTKTARTYDPDLLTSRDWVALIGSYDFYHQRRLDFDLSRYPVVHGHAARAVGVGAREDSGDDQVLLWQADLAGYAGELRLHHIPQHFRHLRLCCNNHVSVNFQDVMHTFVRFNGDYVSGNYALQEVRGIQATADGIQLDPIDFGLLAVASDADMAANQPGCGEALILNYRGPFHKAMWSKFGTRFNFAGVVAMGVLEVYSYWENTAPIHAIDLACENGDFLNPSHWSLWGWR